MTIIAPISSPKVVPLRPAVAGHHARADATDAGPVKQRPSGLARSQPLLSGGTLLTAQQDGGARNGLKGSAADRQNATLQYGQGQGPSRPAATSGSEANRQEKDTTRPGELTEAEQEEVRDLQKRDAEVRRHEQAHANTGRPYTGSPQYEFEQGPDGKRYAVAGHVSIDVSPVHGDPKATIRKMEKVHRAALAPAEPSAQDRAVASQAQQEKLKAQRDVAQGKETDDPLTPQVERAEPHAHGASDEGAPAASPAAAAGGHLGSAQKTPASPAIDLIA